MIFRVLSLLVAVGLVALMAKLVGSLGEGIETRDALGLALQKLAPACLLIAIVLTVAAQFKTPALLALFGGVALIGCALIIQPNLAIWFGLLGDGWFSPLRTGRDALIVATGGVWLLFVFGVRTEQSEG